jgi:hypothetical protein
MNLPCPASFSACATGVALRHSPSYTAVNPKKDTQSGRGIHHEELQSEHTHKVLADLASILPITPYNAVNLWGQDLSDVSILAMMPNVEVLSLSVNHIPSLRDFRHCVKLQVSLQLGKTCRVDAILGVEVHCVTLREAIMVHLAFYLARVAEATSGSQTAIAFRT